jgi:hypothetical protein
LVNSIVSHRIPSTAVKFRVDEKASCTTGKEKSRAVVDTTTKAPTKIARDREDDNPSWRYLINILHGHS